MNGIPRITFYVLLVFLFLTACRSKKTFPHTIETTTDTVISNPVVQVLKDKNSFRVPAVGWTVRIPEKWKKIFKEKNYQLNEDEQDKIRKVTNSKIDDYSHAKQLITIYKNSYNNFTSSMEPFDETMQGSYDEHNIAVHENLKSTYSSKNIYAEYEVAARRIDGIMFDIFDTRIFSAGKRKVALYQSMYSCLINGYYFSMTFNYNNETDKDSFMKIIETSKFSMKK